MIDCTIESFCCKRQHYQISLSLTKLKKISDEYKKNQYIQEECV